MMMCFVVALVAAPCCPESRPGRPEDWNEPADIAGMLEVKEQEWGLPRGMAHCVAYVESRFRPAALSPDGQDRGLMQINRTWEDFLVRRYFRTPGGARRHGFRWDNPEHSATVGCSYLADMIRVYGASAWLGLVAYNWGPGNLSHIDEWDDIPAKKRKYANDTLRLLDAWEDAW